MNGDSVVSWAADKLGLSYVWGGSTDAGYDCSGLTQAAYASQGVAIPRTAQEQYNDTYIVSKNKLRQGDLVYFSDTNSYTNVTHVGIYAGDNRFIHAANSNEGVIISSLDDSWYSSHYVGGGTAGLAINTGSMSGWLGDVENTLNGAVDSAVDAVTQPVKDAAMGLVGNIIQAVAVVAVVAIAAVFFFKAFDIKII